MIGKLVALILVSSAGLIEASEVLQHLTLTETKVGDSVTLTCPVSDNEGKFFHWYKQPHGYMPQKIVSGILSVISFTEQFKEPRFRIRNGNNKYLLTVGNVSKGDEAIYFCQNGTAYEQTVVNGTFLSVKDNREQTNVYVKQHLKTESVQAGDSVTLQCSLLSKNKDNGVQCPGEHSVFWFRSGSRGFNPGVIYTQRNRNDEKGEKSCVYSLSRTIRNSSDAGTYYCAVVTCGQILFGEGTIVKTKLDLLVLVLGVLLAFCVALNCAFIFKIMRRRDCEHCKGEMSASQRCENDRPTSDGSSDLGDAAEAVNYVALNFSTKNAKRLKSNMDSGQECLYSAVEYSRADPHMQHQPTF